MGKRRIVLAITLMLAALQSGAAGADSNLIVGVGEDSLMGRPREAMALARDLGVSAFRLSLLWHPGETQLAPDVRIGLDNAVGAAGDMRIVVAVYGERGLAPVTDAERHNYCTYVRNVLERYPQINDIVIWNEPNLTYYWTPQFAPDESSAAPADYEALLAHCWDLLHAFRPEVNLIGPVVSLSGNDNPNAYSNVSHSPVNFIKKLGEAYRASGRDRPIIDTFGHHPHPPSADERPWRRHDESVYLSMGDWSKLMTALSQAFEGTAQPIPGEGPSIWWLEVGYQTLIDRDKSHLYSGFENWRGMLPAFAGGEPDFPPPSADSPAPDQATQLLDSVRLSYCQPYVEGFFNFLLRDEPQLGRWQSGVLWADGTPKGSYGTFKNAIAEVNEGGVDCSRMKGGGPFIQPKPRTARGAGAAAPAAKTVGVWSQYAATAAWSELGPILWPGGAASLPSGYFEVAAPSRLDYVGSERGPFGFVKLRGRLTSGGRPIAGRTVTVVAGQSVYSATTNAEGVATMRASPPLAAGDWALTVSFLGDPLVRPASAQAKIEVLNSAARVDSTGTIRTARAGVSFHVSFNGRKLNGHLRVRAAGLDLRASRITALGIGKRARSAWFTGFNRKGKRFWANAQDNDRRGRSDRFRLWVDGSRRIAPGKIRSGDVEIKKARPRRR